MDEMCTEREMLRFYFYFFILRMELLFKEVGESWEEQGLVDPVGYNSLNLFYSGASARKLQPLMN